jgi:hypothetical protein
MMHRSEPCRVKSTNYEVRRDFMFFVIVWLKLDMDG